MDGSYFRRRHRLLLLAHSAWGDSSEPLWRPRCFPCRFLLSETSRRRPDTTPHRPRPPPFVDATPRRRRPSPTCSCTHCLVVPATQLAHSLLKTCHYRRCSPPHPTFRNPPERPAWYCGNPTGCWQDRTPRFDTADFGPPALVCWTRPPAVGTQRGGNAPVGCGGCGGRTSGRSPHAAVATRGVGGICARRPPRSPPTRPPGGRPSAAGRHRRRARRGGKRKGEHWRGTAPRGPAAGCPPRVMWPACCGQGTPAAPPPPPPPPPQTPPSSASPPSIRSGPPLLASAASRPSRFRGSGRRRRPPRPHARLPRRGHPPSSSRFFVRALPPPKAGRTKAEGGRAARVAPPRPRRQSRECPGAAGRERGAEAKRGGGAAGGRPTARPARV